MRIKIIYVREWIFFILEKCESDINDEQMIQG